MKYLLFAKCWAWTSAKDKFLWKLDSLKIHCQWHEVKLTAVSTLCAGRQIYNKEGNSSAVHLSVLFLLWHHVLLSESQSVSSGSIFVSQYCQNILPYHLGLCLCLFLIRVYCLTAFARLVYSSLRGGTFLRFFKTMVKCYHEFKPVLEALIWQNYKKPVTTGEKGDGKVDDKMQTEEGWH